MAGEGQYGTVYRAHVKGTGQQVAIKKFKLGEDECTQREIELLQKLKHQNIVRMLELFRENGKLHMVFEYCPQDMLNVLGSYPNGMPEKLVHRYILQMCRALMYVHAKHVIHRDVKPENLLVKGRPEDDDPNENSLKLCDFGVARQVRLQRLGTGGDEKILPRNILEREKIETAVEFFLSGEGGRGRKRKRKTAENWGKDKGKRSICCRCCMKKSNNPSTPHPPLHPFSFIRLVPTKMRN